MSCSDRETHRNRASGTRLPHPFAWLCVLTVLAVCGGSSAASALSDEALIRALRQGGYSIYFRHTATDWSQDDDVTAAGDWTSCDPARMRQLSDAGRATARRVGDAIRALRIPVDKVLSSEYCRAAETARLMRLGPVTTTRDVMNMRAAEFVGGRAAAVRRAQRVLAAPPPKGANAVIVGHGNLMRAATGAYPDEGGSGVFAPKPDTDGGFEILVLLTADDWLRLASRFAKKQ